MILTPSIGIRVLRQAYLSVQREEASEPMIYVVKVTI